VPKAEDGDVAVAALVVAIFSLLVSGAAGIYTKRQADAVRITASNDTARRHEERTPAFEPKLVPKNDGQWYDLTLRLTSGKSVTSLELEIIDGHGLSFVAGQLGVDPSTPGIILQARAEGPRGPEVSTQTTSFHGGCSWLRADRTRYG